MREKELKCMWLVEQQLGVIRRDQVLRWLTRQQLQRRLKACGWEALLPGVYRVKGAPQTWHQELKAIALWADRDDAFSHETAARLHGFGRFKEEKKLVLSIARKERHARTPVFSNREGFELHRVKPFGPKDRWTVEGFRVTSPTRTLLDLGTKATNEDLRATVDEALRRKLTTVEKLAVALNRKGKERPRGHAFLRALVHEYQGGDGPCESELESLVLELLLGSGVPRPDRQQSIKVAGRFRRLDFFFVQHGVILEADGYAYHSDTIAFEKDRERRNSLIARGFVVLQWTWKGLKERPQELLAELATVLKRRVGWKR